MHRIFRFSLAVVSILAGTLTPTTRADLTWTTETAVSGVNEDDNLASLSLTSTGEPRIAYFDENAGGTDTELRFAERVNGTWTNEFVDNRGLNNKLGVSLKLTATDDPRIGFFSFLEPVNNSFGDSRFASRTGTTWTVEDIKKNDDFVGEFIHLVLTSTGVPLAASVNSTTSDLEFSTKAGGTWDTTIIDERGAPAFIRLNGSNTPFVAFVDDDDDGLKVASNASGTWTNDTAIENFNGNSRSISMALNGSTPYISFVDAEGVKLARKSGASWIVETAVADTALEQNVSSLGLDSFGRPYIAYETDGEEVKVAYKEGGSWVSSTVADGTLNFSLGEALAIRGSRIGVVFTLADESDLMFASTLVPSPPSSNTASVQSPGAPGVFNDVFGSGATGSGDSADRTKFLKSNGFISFSVAFDGSYNAFIQLEGQKLSFTGRFNGQQTQTRTLNRPGKSPLRLSVALLKSPRVRVAGSIQTSGSPVNFSALRGSFRKHPFTGRDYSFGIPAPSGTVAGDGYAFLTFADNGNADVNGKLADGTAFSSTTRTIDDGNGNWIVPIHEFLYSKSSGMLWGELRLPKSPSSREDAVEGSLVWLRSSKAPAKIAPIVFLKRTNPHGARYLLKNGDSILSGSRTAAEFELQIDPSGKVLAEPISLSGSWPGTNNPAFDEAPDGFSFSFNDKTGLFSGSFRHEYDGKTLTTQFKGIVFGNPTRLGSGVGYFHIGRESGSVRIVLK